MELAEALSLGMAGIAGMVTFAAIVLMMQVFAAMIQVLRAPLWPVKCVEPGVQQHLHGERLLAVNELTVLGFNQIFCWMEESGPDRHFSVLFRHEAEPALAVLSFQAHMATYPVVFYSFDIHGNVLLTPNMSISKVVDSPSVLRLDPRVKSLAMHWQAHRARLHNLPSLEGSDEEAARRIMALTENAFEEWRNKGAVAQAGGAWYVTPKSALRMALTLLRVHAKVRRGYDCAIIGSEYQSAYFAYCFAGIETYAARLVKYESIKTCLLSMAPIAPVLCFLTLTCGWQVVVVMSAVTLVHEMGRVLAMRALGYRDISIFYGPLPGTSLIPESKELPAWKRVFVQLAGTLPGLFFGVGLLWYLMTHPPSGESGPWAMALMLPILINLLVLLPVLPASGGQLLEFGVFCRWPHMRIVVKVLVLGVLIWFMFWSNSQGIWMVGGIVGGLTLLGLIQSLKLMRLQRIPLEGLNEGEQLTKLFEEARKTFRTQSLIAQIGPVRLALLSSNIRPPRLWESMLILLLLLGLWAGAGFAITRYWDQFRLFSAEKVLRTQAQAAFDSAYSSYARDNYAKASPWYKKLVQQARELDATDVRQIDMAVMKTFWMREPQRGARLDALLKQGRDGYYYSINGIACQRLNHIYWKNHQAAPQEQEVALREAIAQVMQLAPSAYGGTIEARIRVAEAVDLSGEADRALAMLNAEKDTAEMRACRCGKNPLLHPHVWFLISHDRASHAVTLLQRPEYAEDVKRPGSELALDYAWALLSANRISEGVEQMRLAAYDERAQPGFTHRLSGVPTYSPNHLIYPLDMMHALRQAGRTDEARTLMTEETRWACKKEYRNPDDPAVRLWERVRFKLLRQAAVAACPVAERAL